MFTPTRLQLARQRRQFTAAALARQLGLSARLVSDFEHGRREPTAQEIVALARALDFPVEFFEADEPAQIAESTVSFRTRAKLPAKRRTAALAAGQLAVEFNAYLEARFTLPAVNVPTFARQDPEHAAEMVRTRWGLGVKPAPNLVHLLEAHGVRVFSLGVDHTDVDAFSFRHGETPFVFLNNSKLAEQGRFDAAHELGHVVLHSGSRTLDGVDVEAEANAFAGALLMPEVDVLTYVPDDPSLEQVLRGCARWRVSAPALTQRLRELRQLSDDRYRSLCAEIAGVSGEHGMQVRESSQLLAKVFRALREQGTPPHELAGELRLSMKELNSVVFGLVVTVLPGAMWGTARSGSARPPHLRLV